VRRALAVAAAIALLAACNGGNDEPSAGDCVTVDVTVSPEKFDLLTELAREFNRSDAARVGDQCAFVRVQRKSSGAAADVLATGWTDDAAEGPKPVVWSPAASSWGAVVNQRLAERGQPAVAPLDARPFMLTPLVIAMPKPMADALGYPATPVGYADLIALARDPGGWASKGHPEWGAFKLGKTNPNFSTSALSATIAQYYAATGKSRDLTLEDLDRPNVVEFAKAVESSVVHYGDITLTFLNNWFRNDVRGTSLTYVSAVAVEEKSVIDYNLGNPDGITDTGEKPRKPRVPLVAVYPKEGTLFSDNPYYVLDAPWVDENERTAARAFEQYVQEPENQRKVLRFGFRPGNPAVAVGEPIVTANGVDPAQPQTTLGVPTPEVLVRLVQRWGEHRKGARVLLTIDVSGSMGDDGGDGETKLDLAKRAAIASLDQFKADDHVGLRIFSTDIGPRDHPDWLDVVPIAPIGAQREQLASRIRALVPTSGTPLYSVAASAYAEMKTGYDPARINAVLLLTDGRNDDPRNNSPDAVDRLLSDLRAGNEGQGSTAVRLFAIAYGKDADLGVLRRMAEATNAAVYDAKDPKTIEKVFVAVVSNF
jgi:Ca-activated chloride channel family protein